MTISLSDFNTLSEKDKKKTLESLKKEIGVNGLVKEWNVSRSKIYSMLHEYDIAVSAAKHKLKPKRPAKTTEASKPKSAVEASTSSAEASSAPGSIGARRSGSLPAELEFDIKDGAKFSLYLETQGNASFINETVQLLLGSQKFAGSNLQVNISLQEI
ncbi:MAG: hypothetical protein VB084_03895 [Syntrophomonadaceae bacterium]|nr:hypothetical protein [Syntrophomonadaceae bacterium]